MSMQRFELEHGAPVRHADFTADDRQRLTGRLPPLVLEYLEKNGWCSFRKGAFWFCDPDALRPVRDAWLPRAPKSEIFLRTCCGDFWMWDGEMVWVAFVHLSAVRYAANDVASLFGSMLTDKPLLKALGIPKFSNLGHKTFGPMAANATYHYEPPLQHGGDSRTATLMRAPIQETLVLLSQLQDIAYEHEHWFWQRNNPSLKPR